MIEIDFKINQYGLSRKVFNVGNIYIANIGGNYEKEDGEIFYDYVYCIYEPECRYHPELTVHGVVKKHCQNNPIFELLKRICVDEGKSKCDISQEYADRLIKEFRK